MLISLIQAAGIGLILLLWPKSGLRRGVLLALLGAAVLFPAYFPHTSDRWIKQNADFYQKSPIVSWLQQQEKPFRISNPGALIHHSQLKDYWKYYRWNFRGGLVYGLAAWSTCGQLYNHSLNQFVAATRNPRLYDLMNIAYQPQGYDRPPGGSKYGAVALKPGGRLQLDLHGLAPYEGAVELAIQGGPLQLLLKRGNEQKTVSLTQDPGQRVELAAGRYLELACQSGQGKISLVKVDGRDILQAAPRWAEVMPGLWKNRHVIPRAFVVHKYQVLPDRKRVYEMLPGLEPGYELLLEQKPEFVHQGPVPKRNMPAWSPMATMR